MDFINYTQMSSYLVSMSMDFELPFIVSSLLLILLSCFLSRNALAEINEFTVTTSATVDYLPGLGPLPFNLETGYVGVGASNQDQIFYYFAASQDNPAVDPLILWLTGGPGCSGLSAFAGRIGPLVFKNLEYHDRRGIPPLELNPYSWTKVASMIFLDQPVGSGFSYTERKRDKQVGDVDSAEESYEFLRKWLKDHPQFISNPLYIGGDSYAGKIVPVLSFRIATGINKGDEPKIKFQGYLMGNPVMDAKTDLDSRVPFAHGMGLISNELYMSTKKNCKGAYTIAPNKHCKDDLDTIEKLLSGIESHNILDIKCPVTLPRSYSPLRARSLEEDDLQLYQSPEPLPGYGCPSYHYLLAYYWANNDDVRKALGIRKGSVSEWISCPSLSYSKDIDSTISYHRNLSAQAYRALIYSGDHDYVIPHIGTQAWIKSLNYSVVDEWRPWFLVNQVAGYTRTYSNHMTFATVKGAGHIAPTYKPMECFAMINRWISHSSL